MSLAIKRVPVNNLPPHLSYVSTLPDTTQKPKHGIGKLKQRLSDTWDHVPQGIIDEAIDQSQTWLRACVKAKGRHFEHSHTTGSQSLHTHQNWFFSEPLTLLIGRQHKLSVFV